MTEESQIPAPVTKPLSMNPEAIRKRKERAEKRDKLTDALLQEQNSPSDRIKALKKKWQDNWDALAPEEQKKVNVVIDEWNYVHLAMRLTVDSIRADQEYNTPEKGIAHRPEEYLAEVEEFAKKYPPIEYQYRDGSPCVLRKDRYCSFFEEITDRRIADEGFYFRTFGIGVDGISESAYHDFLAHFRMWYRMYRWKLTLATTDEEYGPEYLRTWEQVDAMCLQNPRLKEIVRNKPAPAPMPVAPVVPDVPLTPSEQINRTVDDIYAAQLSTEVI